jgi:hypothetical protein
MDLKNALTKPRADQLYEPLSAYTQEDVTGLIDNVSILLGAAASYSSFKIEYMVEKLVSHHKEDGTITISHDGTASYLTSHEFNYFEAAPFTGITYGTTLTGGNVSWTIVTSGVDENLSFRYRITRVPAPV